MHVNNLLQKLGHRLSAFNWICHILDKKSITAYFNGLVLSHLDYADIIWRDQPGLTTQIKQLQSFQSRITKKTVKGKVTSAEALTLLWWVPLHATCFGHRCCLVQGAMKGEILNTSMSSDPPWANNTVAISKMITCPKLASQKWNGTETKHITKQ